MSARRARPRLRRRAADPARAEGRPARGRLRGRSPPRPPRRRSTRAAVQPPDAAIIDLVLPDGDGVEVCRALREWSEMPIIVLSAVGDEDAEGARARGRRRRLRDQAVRPARAGRPAAGRAAPRRRAGRRAGRSRADGLEVDLAARVVRRDGEEVHLTPIEFDLLRALARNRGPADDPPRAADRGLGPGVRRRHRVLRTHIANLRRKIEPDGDGRATSAPTRASATASRLNAFTKSLCRRGASSRALDGTAPSIDAMLLHATLD